MNKKELNEILQDECDCYLTEAEFNKVWHWLKQQIKDARIDENEKFKKAVIDEAVMVDYKGNDIKQEGEYESGMDSVGSGLLRRIKNRIKELSK